jgi:hypothetical protein
MMMTMMRCPSSRPRAGLVLFTHLLLLGLLPVGEGLHRHGHTSAVELHDATEECGHDAHHGPCSLLHIGSAPAHPVVGGPLAGAVAVVSPLPRPTSPVGLPDEPISPALPRAPPVG